MQGQAPSVGPPPPNAGIPSRLRDLLLGLSIASIIIITLHETDGEGASLIATEKKVVDAGSRKHDGPIQHLPKPLIHPAAAPPPTTVAVIASAHPAVFKPRGCHIIPQTGPRQMHQDAGKDDKRMTPAFCAESCVSLGYSHFEVVGKSQCWCGSAAYPASQPSVSDNECNQKCPGDPSQFCGGRGRGTAYEVTSFVPPVLTFFLEPARNRGSLFFSGRLKRWASGRYVYRTVIINNRLSGDAEQFLRETCSINPGPKVFIGHGELLLRNWPGNAVMIIT